MSAASHAFPFRLRDLRCPAATQCLSLGCPLLDEMMGGGIPVGCLTEVVGESLETGREEEGKGEGGAIGRRKRKKKLNLALDLNSLFKTKARPPRARPSSASASSSPRSSPRIWEGSTALPCGSARRRATPPSAGWRSSRGGARRRATTTRTAPRTRLLLLLLSIPLTPLPRRTTSFSKRAWPPRRSSWRRSTGWSP